MSEPADSAAAAAAAAAAEAPPQPAGPLVGQADPAQWSNGILAALAPGISAADAQISGVFAAQSQLALQIDRLTAAMASFQSLSKNAQALAPYTAKLVSSRKRVKKLTADIGKVQGRLDDIRTLVRKKEGISAATAKPAAAAAPASTGLFDKISSSLKSSKDSSPALSRVTSIGTSGAPAAAAAPSASATAAAPSASSSETASANASPSTAASAPAADSTGAAPSAAASAPADSAAAAASAVSAADSTAPSSASSLAPVPEGAAATAAAAPPADPSARAKLIIVVIAVAILLAFGMCLTVVIFGHPDDKNMAWLPKIVTVFGLWLSFASMLVLPYDVANSSGGGGGVRVDVVWQIVYILIACLISFIIPFAFFYYENDMDDEAAEEAGFCDSQKGQALKYTIGITAVFFIVLGIMFAFLAQANVPVTRYAQIFRRANDVNDDEKLPWDCIKDVVGNFCAVSRFNWVIPVSFPLYIIAFMAFLGWFFFTIFAGVGFFALPLDLIQEYTTRPEPMTTKTYFDERASLGSRSKSLIEIASKLSAEMEKRNTGSKKRQEGRDMRNLEKHYFFLKKDFQILTIAYKLRGGNPLEYIGKFVLGIIFGCISLSWWIHIAIYILPAKPVHPFLNNFFVALTDNVPGFPLFGVLAFALWSFHLLFCVVKGNFRLGVRFLVIKLYPMEIGNTLMNAFLFNTWIILLTSVPAVQFCVQAFPVYTSGTEASIMFGTQIRYLTFFRYFFLNNVFIIAMLCLSGLTVLFLMICPRNRADEVENTLDRIAKNSNTKTGLKDALEEDDD